MERWALVTGGAQNLGREIALNLAGEGYSVLVHYRSSKERALEVIAACRNLGVDAELIQADFSEEGRVGALADEVATNYPHLCALINNVGNYLVRSTLDTSLAEWHKLFETNFCAPLQLCKRLAPTLIANRGRIVSLGTCGLNQGVLYKKAPAYALLKQALLGLTKSLAFELGPHGVTVNMVSPGYLEGASDEAEKIPLKRHGRFREVARVVSFLLQEDSSYITGQNIEVAGGVQL